MKQVCANCRHFRKTTRRRGRCDILSYRLYNAKKEEKERVYLNVLRYHSCPLFAKPLTKYEKL